MSLFHAVVWIDHAEAHVLHFSREDVAKQLVHGKPHRHLHTKKNAQSSGHAAEDQGYFHQIAEALNDAGEILVVGPANAKTEFVKHLNSHDKELAKKIVAVETVDHPSDGQLLAFARKYFRAADRMK
ncbi:MAG: translational machinery protein, partial [Terriglobia bacterium]